MCCPNIHFSTFQHYQHSRKLLEKLKIAEQCLSERHFADEVVGQIYHAAQLDLTNMNKETEEVLQSLNQQ